MLFLSNTVSPLNSITAEINAVQFIQLLHKVTPKFCFPLHLPVVIEQRFKVIVAIQGCANKSHVHGTQCTHIPETKERNLLSSSHMDCPLQCNLNFLTVAECYSVPTNFWRAKYRNTLLGIPF